MLQTAHLNGCEARGQTRHSWPLTMEFLPIVCHVHVVAKACLEVLMCQRKGIEQSQKLQIRNRSLDLHEQRLND